MLPEPPPVLLPMRDGSLSIAQLADLYLQHYEGRDRAVTQRIGWWVGRIGALRLDELSDDHLHAALDHLERNPPRYYAGRDADGKAIFKAKKNALAPSTLNRYHAAVSGMLSWAMRRRIVPKGWDHPGRRLEARPERNAQTRFLTDKEREDLLAACRASEWPRLYLLVLMGLTTGARKSELQALRWGDIDLELAIAHVRVSKNGDAKALPLTPPVVDELRKFVGAPASLVFASRLRPSKPYVFEARWRQALKAAKIRAFRFHDLRHSCASWLAQRGASLLEVADVLGHRSVVTARRYAHLTTTHRARLVNRVLGDLR
jgi:integrase